MPQLAGNLKTEQDYWLKLETCDVRPVTCDDFILISLVIIAEESIYGHRKQESCGIYHCI
jgi:hypothetical protein